MQSYIMPTYCCRQTVLQLLQTPVQSFTKPQALLKVLWRPLLQHKDSTVTNKCAARACACLMGCSRSYTAAALLHAGCWQSDCSKVGLLLQMAGPQKSVELATET
jgi:hypothetical protein